MAQLPSLLLAMACAETTTARLATSSSPGSGLGDPVESETQVPSREEEGQEPGYYEGLAVLVGEGEREKALWASAGSHFLALAGVVAVAAVAQHRWHAAA